MNTYDIEIRMYAEEDADLATQTATQTDNINNYTFNDYYTDVYDYYYDSNFKPLVRPARSRRIYYDQSYNCIHDTFEYT